MLKQALHIAYHQLIVAAAFGRLCVETLRRNAGLDDDFKQPPSGGCVLKHKGEYRISRFIDAATFGRLCVETISPWDDFVVTVSSRLRAAVC